MELSSPRTTAGVRLQSRIASRAQGTSTRKGAIRTRNPCACGCSTTRTSSYKRSASRSQRCGRRSLASKPSWSRWNSRRTLPPVPIPPNGMSSASAGPLTTTTRRLSWTQCPETALKTSDVGSIQNTRNFSSLRRMRAIRAKRRDTLQQAESLMLNDYPLLPVYFYVSRRLVQPGISAPAINPMNRTYSRYFRPGS